MNSAALGRLFSEVLLRANERTPTNIGAEMSLGVASSPLLQSSLSLSSSSPS
jgi:hypothetical protein